MNDTATISIDVDARPIRDLVFKGDNQVYRVRRPKPDHAQEIFATSDDLKQLAEAHANGGDFSNLDNPAKAGIAALWAQLKTFLVDPDDYGNLRERAYGKLTDEAREAFRHAEGDDILEPSDINDDVTFADIMYMSMRCKEVFDAEDNSVKRIDDFAQKQKKAQGNRAARRA